MVYQSCIELDFIKIFQIYRIRTIVDQLWHRIMRQFINCIVHRIFAVFNSGENVADFHFVHFHHFPVDRPVFVVKPACYLN
jgi:hypothetical protein